MNGKLVFKLTVDLTMTILMLFAIAYQLTGNTAHEIIGAALFVLFILHNILNRRWYFSLTKGQYDIRRAVSTVINILILCAMVILIVTGAMISVTLAPYLPIRGGFLTRQVHTLSAFWGLLLMSAHLGMHWEMILGMFRKASGTGGGIFTTVPLRAVTAVIFIYGIRSSFVMDIGSKLTMRSTFSYWDFENSTWLFFLAYLSIMGVYICLFYYILRLVKKPTKNS